MYYADDIFSKFGKKFNLQTIKNVVIIAILVICVFFVLKGCGPKENFNKERKELNDNIKSLQVKYDSLERVSTKLQTDYIVYQNNYIKDSITIDSLGSEIDLQSEKAIKSENKANTYYKKYMANNKKINYLESNPTLKTGDSLLNSLGKKIN